MISPEEAASPALRAAETFFSFSLRCSTEYRRAELSPAERSIIVVLIDDDELHVASILIDDRCEEARRLRLFAPRSGLSG